MKYILASLAILGAILMIIGLVKPELILLALLGFIIIVIISFVMGRGIGL